MMKFLLTSIFLIGQLTFASESVVSPRLFMHIGWLFDMQCQQSSGFEIEPAWQKELFERHQEFQNVWDDSSKSLIDVSQALAGRNFQRSEYSVTLSLCNYVPIARPFIMTVKLYLKSYTEGAATRATPWGLNAFVALTHHELLHHLIDNTESLEFREFSKLIKKYETESSNVLAHVHLMAIQKRSYESLRRADLLDEARMTYEYIGGDYKRAWEIVNDEGPIAFLDELKGYNERN